MILNVQARQQSLADEFGLDFDDLEELQSLVDQVLNEQTDDDGFLIFLRLPTVPQYLVEAFDFKMLNRYAEILFLLSLLIFFVVMWCKIKKLLAIWVKIYSYACYKWHLY